MGKIVSQSNYLAHFSESGFWSHIFWVPIILRNSNIAMQIEFFKWSWSWYMVDACTCKTATFFTQIKSGGDGQCWNCQKKTKRPNKNNKNKTQINFVEILIFGWVIIAKLRNFSQNESNFILNQFYIQHSVLTLSPKHFHKSPMGVLAPRLRKLDRVNRLPMYL